MTETLTATIEHEDASGLARVTYECDVFETLACTIAARWRRRTEERTTRRHKWRVVDGCTVAPDRVPCGVRERAANVLAGRVRRVVEGRKEPEA